MMSVTPTDASEEATTQAQRYRVIGTRPIRHDGTDKVTGRALYGADIELAGMLSGAVLRSPHAHAHIQHQRGDLEQGFRAAAVIVEREFFTGTVHQGYIEPQTATALYNPDGQITIWCSTQGAFSVRSQVSEILQIPLSKIKVVPMEIGGGFGGKIDVYLQPVAVLLSRKSGHRPVKMTMSRSEVLAATGPTSGSIIRVKMGADRQGRITAAEAYLAYEAGAFPGSPVGAGAGIIFAPYRIDNLRIDGYDVVVNKPKAAAYRAPGASNAAFAAETVIDEICKKLDMDPLDFRLLNGAKEGDRRSDGPILTRIGFLETVEAARDHPHYTAPLEGPHRGRGVASGFWFNWSGGKSSVSGSVNADGTVSFVEGSTDIGGSRVALAMQLAETLGIPAEYVKPQVADTDSVGYSDVTAGSRTTFATGWAAYELGQSLLRQLRERAALHWEVRAEEVDFASGTFSTAGKHLTFNELAALLDETGGPVVASTAVDPSAQSPAFATHIVDVEVDPETGKVQILRYTAVQDAGTAVHPSYVEGQMQGGAVQGIGWALNEEYVYDEAGRLLNASFLDYRIPTCADVPSIEPVIVEVPSPKHPLLRELTGGQDRIAVPGKTVRQVIENLEAIYPGVEARLCDGERLRPGLSIAVDGTLSSQNLRQPLDEASEVHFIPAIGGG